MKRTAAIVLAMSLAAVSCSSTDPQAEGSRAGTYGSGIRDDDTDAGRKSGGAKVSPDAEQTVPVGSEPAGRGSSRAAPPPPSAPATYSDNGLVGMNARDYLGSSRAKRLIVEVDYVQGYAPRPAALDHLRKVLGREAAKPDGVQVLRGDVIPTGDGSYTFEQIAALEERHRDRRSGGETVTMWVVYLDGRLEGEGGTLGVAYRASSAAIFSERINAATTAAVTGTAIERAVLVHEVGHLLGLVNLVYESRHDREDPSSKGHSTQDDSVMLAAVRDITVAAVLAGGPPDDFNAADRDDLRGLREGRL
jgi:hypothetical protein